MTPSISASGKCFPFSHGDNVAGSIGALARAIQELAHADLTITQRYMHLTPAALDAAIRLLEEPNGPTQNRVGSVQKVGDMETGRVSEVK